MIPILLIAALAGFAAAGFVWYGWEFADNLLTMRKHRQQKKPRDAEPHEKEINAEEEISAEREIVKKEDSEKAPDDKEAAEIS